MYTWLLLLLLYQVCLKTGTYGDLIEESESPGQICTALKSRKTCLLGHHFVDCSSCSVKKHSEVWMQKGM